MKWIQDDFQQKLMVDLKVKQENQKYIVIKRMLKDTVLLQSLTQRDEYMILSIGKMQYHTLQVETYLEVRIRRQTRIYNSWQETIKNFKSEKRNKWITIIGIIAIATLIGFGTCQQQGTVAMVMFPGAFLLIGAVVSCYQRHEYKFGKKIQLKEQDKTRKNEKKEKK